MQQAACWCGAAAGACRSGADAGACARTSSSEKRMVASMETPATKYAYTHMRVLVVLVSR